MLKLTNQTAAITLVQFISIMILGVPDTTINIVSTCHSDSSNCVSNMVVSLILYLLTAGWFALIMIIGYLAQRRRSRQFAVILIGLEFVTLMVSGYIDFPHDSNWLNKATSLLDAFLSVLVIYVATRLFISGSKRMVKRPNVVTRARRAR